MIKILVLAAGAIVASTQAWAWSAHVEGPDVFGATTVFAVDNGAREDLVIQCNSETDLAIAMVSRKKEFEETPSTPAKFLIQVDGATPFTLDAFRRDWNDNYVGIVAFGRDAEIISVIRAIQAGKRKINAGADVGGVRITASFSVRGSTAAMAKVLEHCKLSNIPPA